MGAHTAPYSVQAIGISRHASITGYYNTKITGKRLWLGEVNKTGSELEFVEPRLAIRLAALVSVENSKSFTNVLKVRVADLIALSFITAPIIRCARNPGAECRSDGARLLVLATELILKLLKSLLISLGITGARRAARARARIRVCIRV